MTYRSICAAMALGIVPALSLCAGGQNKADLVSPDSTTVTAEYPRDRVGVLILTVDWVSVPSQAPVKSHLKHGLAPTFTYGIAPATAVSDYDGLHAQVEVPPGQPVICICHVLSLPGDPVIVRLHPKKNLRELDGGNLHIRGKVEEAEKNDLLPVNVTQPENMVWLIQPQDALPPGEYALMLGTQNLSIFPFTVAAPKSAPAGVPKN